MATFQVVYATTIMLLAILAFRDAAGRQTVEAFVEPSATTGDVCVASDINIQQTQTSGVGIPTLTCVLNSPSPRFTISNVIVNCGEFHSATFVNPNTFKRYGAGTCIVNNGGVIQNGKTIRFEYAEMRQNLSLKSAKVTCS